MPTRCLWLLLFWLGLLAGLLPGPACGQDWQLLPNTGHATNVEHLALSASGAYLASADAGQVKVWDVGARKVLTVLDYPPDQARVRGLCWSSEQEVVLLLGGTVPRVACHSRIGVLRWSSALPAGYVPDDHAQCTYLPGRCAIAIGLGNGHYRAPYHLLLLAAATGQLRATSPPFEGYPNGVAEDEGGTLLCLFGTQVWAYQPADGQRQTWACGLDDLGPAYALRPWRRGVVVLSHPDDHTDRLAWYYRGHLRWSK